jgi:hypothetical protein
MGITTYIIYFSCKIKYNGFQKAEFSQSNNNKANKGKFEPANIINNLIYMIHAKYLRSTCQSKEVYL